MASGTAKLRELLRKYPTVPHGAFMLRVSFDPPQVFYFKDVNTARGLGQEISSVMAVTSMVMKKGKHGMDAVERFPGQPNVKLEAEEKPRPIREAEGKSMLESIDQVIRYAGALNMEYIIPWKSENFLSPDMTSVLKEATPFSVAYGFEMPITVGNPNTGVVQMRNLFFLQKVKSPSSGVGLTKYAKTAMKSVNMEDFLYEFYGELLNQGFLTEDMPSISKMKDMKALGGAFVKAEMSDGAVWFFRPRFFIEFRDASGDIICRMETSYGRRAKNLRIRKYIEDISDILGVTDTPRAGISLDTPKKVTIGYEVDATLTSSTYTVPSSWTSGESKE